ncbi:hypothetical protein Prum_055050 [Phytohabitans rumicis]|uniref:Uncharacterized protein n=1 Tax=Phytohabitans rumicis TaxID=1076125 RepID=A0A6V8L3M9_9ACTN|nr:hypothetical protein Prum_055050 [Phytohabitans rumicis]
MCTISPLDSWVAETFVVFATDETYFQKGRTVNRGLGYLRRYAQAGTGGRHSAHPSVPFRQHVRLIRVGDTVLEWLIAACW